MNERTFWWMNNTFETLWDLKHSLNPKFPLKKCKVDEEAEEALATKHVKKDTQLQEASRNTKSQAANITERPKKHECWEDGLGFEYFKVNYLLCDMHNHRN